jgi:dTDP-4-amino-4,6-dideoxygalactose transaminase
MNAAFRGIASYEELSDMSAALGLVQLAHFDAFLTRRREISRLFRTSLLKTDHKQFGNGSLDFESNGWNFPVVLDSKYEDVVKFSKKYNVSCRKMFVDSLGYPLKSRYPSFPHALPTLLRGVAFPLYPFLKGSEVDTMVKVISHLP